MTEPIDFTALRLSEHRRDVIVASVMLQSGHELTRRANGSSPILFLGTWARPTLAAAAVLALICGTMLTKAAQGADYTQVGGIAESIGVSSTTTTLLASNSAPTMSVMLAAEEIQ